MKGIAFYGDDFFLIKEGNELLRENITRILLTSKGERVMSRVASKLKEYLFDPESVLQEDVEDELRSTISKWEPRAQVNSVEAEMTDEHTATINLFLTNRETLENFQFNRVVRF